MLLGLTRPTAGSVRLLGRPMPQERTQALARVGAIVEEPRFHPFLTGRENLAIVAAAREREAHGRIDAALTRVGSPLGRTTVWPSTRRGCDNGSALRAASSETPSSFCSTSR
jgi:ABC-type multidrug transport system ATPase subunit